MSSSSLERPLFVRFAPLPFVGGTGNLQRHRIYYAPQISFSFVIFLMVGVPAKLNRCSEAAAALIATERVSLARPRVIEFSRSSGYAAFAVRGGGGILAID